MRRDHYRHMQWLLGLLCLLMLALMGKASADTYQYDQYGRLVGVTYSDGSTIAYAYDDAGNRTTVTQVATP